jgi:hypothetical protein
VIHNIECVYSCFHKKHDIITVKTDFEMNNQGNRSMDLIERMKEQSFQSISRLVC